MRLATRLACLDSLVLPDSYSARYSAGCFAACHVYIAADAYEKALASLDAFTAAYIEAALWSSDDNSDEGGGEPLDANYSAEDIAPETLAAMIADCARFQAEHADALASVVHYAEHGERGDSHGETWSHDSLAGHEFWLNRNGHGCGFWDGSWSPEDTAETLSEACKAYGEVSLYVGDDGLVHEG